jgi:hypothetical protein
MALGFFWMSVMFLMCEIALDVDTREVVHFTIFDPRSSSGERGRLPKSKSSRIRPGRNVVLDRSRLDVLAVPPYPDARPG